MLPTLKRLLPVRLKTWLRRLVLRAPFRRAAEAYLAAWYEADTQRLWYSDSPPEWFDHRADIYRFSRTRNPLWAERGVFSRQLMSPGARVLDLCCGDGFYAYHFYAEMAAHVDAVDFDPTAITHARTTYHHPRIRYAVSDVRNDAFPSDTYDVIVWDGAIEHFTPGEVAKILKRCVEALEPTGGVLSGYTITSQDHTSHPEHEHEFESADELVQTLLGYFPYAATFENDAPDRHNIYFRAGFSRDSVEPFRVKSAS